MTIGGPGGAPPPAIGYIMGYIIGIITIPEGGPSPAAPEVTPFHAGITKRVRIYDLIHAELRGNL